MPSEEKNALLEERHLVGTYAPQDNPWGFYQYIDIHPKGVVLDVIDIFLCVQVQRFIGTAVYLPPTCHALGYGKTFVLPRFVLA
jgi:hypothetical protein